MAMEAFVVFPSIRSAAVTLLLAFLISVVSLGRGQQASTPPTAGTNSSEDAAKAAAQAATSAATNAQQAAGSAQTAAGTAQSASGRADDSAKTAQDAADAAAKAAADAKSSADVSTNNVKILNSGAAVGSLPHRKTSRGPVGDYVPCLFDDGEIREMRSLEQPPTPPTVPKGVPLDRAGAEAVATVVQQTLIQSTLAPVAGGIGSGKTGSGTRSTQLSMQPEVMQQIQDFASTLTSDKFVGLLPSQVADAVESSLSEQIANVRTVREIAQSNQALAIVIKALAASVAAAVSAIPSPGPKFPAPDDVSCSFSILQWKETRDTFGRRVANEYVAIQVNVRNLNQQNEFLIHDIQIAVDTGLNRAQFGRFQAARDKLIVRDVAQRGQTEDRRNIIINVLQAAGAVAGGASTAVTQGQPHTMAAVDLASAVAIFQGPFITGAINIFPDHTLEHLNHINDLAFSASSTNKTVVPIQGSVPLVTFLSERPLEQLPFARCGSPAKRGFFRRGDPTKVTSDDPRSSQYRFCKLDLYDQYDLATSTPSPFYEDYYMSPYPFRNWNGAALDVLEHRVFVVIAGVHIKEVAKTPTFTSISCAPGNDATIALAKITGLTATCTLKGTDLDLVAQVELQNATDSTDKTKIEGTSSVSGDTTQATVQFNTKDLAGLKGTTYTLYYSLKGGSPEKSSLTVTVQQVISFSPAALSFSQTDKGPKSVTVTNNSAKDLNITKVELTGTNKSDFGNPTGTCVDDANKTPIPTGKSCTVSMTFSGKGASSASLSITDDGAGSPHTVALTATAP